MDPKSTEVRLQALMERKQQLERDYELLSVGKIPAVSLSTSQEAGARSSTASVDGVAKPADSTTRAANEVIASRSKPQHQSPDNSSCQASLTSQATPCPATNASVSPTTLVTEKIRDATSCHDARRKWLHSRAVARREGRRTTLEAGKEPSAPKTKKKKKKPSRDADHKPAAALSLQKLAGMRLPPPAWMPGQTAEERKKREAQVAVDFAAGMYDLSSQWKKKEVEEKAKAGDRYRVREQVLAQIRPEMNAVDWKVVMRGSYPSKYRMTTEMLKELPTERAILAAKCLLDAEAEDVHGYPWFYLAYLSNALEVIEKPDPLHDGTTTRNRIKLALLGSRAAKITEYWERKQSQLEGAAASKAKDEMEWSLQMLQELANPLARAVWKAGQRRKATTSRDHGKLVYVNGLPADLKPVMPQLTPSKWESRRKAVYLWSPCVQCETAGVGECSSARLLTKNPSYRPCLRCRRLGLMCVRGDINLEHSTDKDLEDMGLARWETYEAADQKSLTKKEAQTVAKEMLETRGKKLLNVCGTMVDAEDAKGFAPPRVVAPSVRWYREEKTGSEDVRQKWVSKAALSQGDIFAERMAKLRCDEYWEDKGKKAGRGRQDFVGVRAYADVSWVEREPIPAKLLAI